MTPTEHPAPYRPEPSGRFDADLPTESAEVPGPVSPEPKASPVARGWTIIVGLALLGVAAVTVRDLLILKGSVTGTQLLPPVFEWFATVTGQGWMLWAGIACAVLALYFLVVTLRPRRRTHIAFSQGTDLYGRPVDVARLSTAAARRVPGVLSARSVATRKKIAVTVVTAVGKDSSGTIEDRVHADVTDLARLLQPSPDVSVTVTPGSESS